MMRLFERAISRAGLPASYSQGFNPRPRLSLPLPRPVGIASADELLVIGLDEPLAEAEVFARLAGQMPGGLRLLECRRLSGRAAARPRVASHELDLPADLVESTAERLNTVLNAPEWPVRRFDPGSPAEKTIDLRPCLLTAQINGTTLCWTVAVGAGGSVKPAEVLQAFGLDPRHWQHRVRRTKIEWEASSPEGPDLPGQPRESH